MGNGDGAKGSQAQAQGEGAAAAAGAQAWGDDRDAFIFWLRGEFAAANAIIDTLCRHLQLVGQPGEYDHALACVQQRRYNWTLVLHMQQYFSVAEVVIALQQVLWRKQQGLSPDHVPAEGGGRGGSRPLLPLSKPDSGAVEKRCGRRPERDASVAKSVPSVVEAGGDPGPSCPDAQIPLLVKVGELKEAVSETQVSEAAPAADSGAKGVQSDAALSSTTLLKSEEVEDTIDKQHVAPQRHNKQQSESHFCATGEEEERRLGMLKSSKNYSCIEMIEGKPVNVVEGLELHENVLNDVETSQLLGLINELVASGKRGEDGAGRTATGTKKWQKERVRETIQFNLPASDAMEDDDKQSPSLVKDEPAESIPGIFLAVIERLVRWHIIPASKRPDFCSINISEEGDYVRNHADHQICERPFCTLSITTECSMVFGRFLKMERPGEFNGPFKLPIPPGSVLVLQGNSADVARYAIPTLPARRISLLFGKKLSSKTSTAHPSSTTTAPWTPPRQGIMCNPGASTGSPSRPLFAQGKPYNFPPTTGVLPVPAMRPSIPVPQPAPGIQPLFPNTSPLAAGFPPLSPLSSGWSPVSRPTRAPSAGTGVFFPSSGSPRPFPAANQRRQGLLPVTPTLQKANSSPSSLPSSDVPAAPTSPSPPSTASRPSKPGGPGGPDQVASPRKSGGGKDVSAEMSQKSEANGSRAGKDEHSTKTSSNRPKAPSATKMNTVLVGPQSQQN